MGNKAYLRTMPQKIQRQLSIENGKPWLCTQPALKEIIRKSEVESDFLAQADEPVDPIQTQQGVAIIPIIGSIFRYPNLFTAFGMGVSVEDIDVAIQLAKEDKDIQSIVFKIDSPGGQASGIDELAQSIRNIDKPTVAYVADLGASGAYWLATAADKIIAARSSFVGSIGAMAVFYDESKVYEQVGADKYAFYSTDSPQKITDPATDSGKKQIMDVLNYTADLFISSVAEYRGTSSEDVKKNFGRGALVNAKEALNLGMVDGIGSYEQALSLAASNGIEGLSQKVKKTLTVNKKENIHKSMGKEITSTEPGHKHVDNGHKHPALNATTDPEYIRKCERNRIIEIQGLASCSEDRAYLEPYIDDGSSPQVAAFNLLQEQLRRKQAVLQLRAEDTSELEAVGVSGQSYDPEEAQYQRVFGHIKNYGNSLKGEKNGN